MSNQRPTTHTPPPTREASRGIGTRGLVVFYITNLVGAGVLVVPGLAARTAGPASFLAWAALALLSFPVARLFAHASARHPDCGGIGAVIKIGLGRRAGETASLLLVAVFVLFNPVMGMASASYACDLFGLPAACTMPAAAAFMLLSVGFCFARLGTAARVQGAALIALLAGLGVAVALAIPSMSTARLTPIAPHGWLAVGSALPIVFLSFIGWESVSAMAEEVRDPRRSFPRAIRISVPIVAIIYLTIVAAFLASPHPAGALVMPTLLGPAAGEHARALGDILALFVIGLCTNSLVMCGSRLVVAAARDGLLPIRIASRSGRTGAPAAALLALACAYLLTITAIAVFHLRESDAVSLTTAIFMILYLATAAGVLRERPDRTISAAALLTAAGAICMLAFTAWALPVAVLLTIALTLGVAAKHRGRPVIRPLRGGAIPRWAPVRRRAHQAERSDLTEADLEGQSVSPSTPTEATFPRGSYARPRGRGRLGVGALLLPTLRGGRRDVRRVRCRDGGRCWRAIRVLPAMDHPFRGLAESPLVPAGVACGIIGILSRLNKPLRGSSPTHAPVAPTGGSEIAADRAGGSGFVRVGLQARGVACVGQLRTALRGWEGINTAAIGGSTRPSPFGEERVPRLVRADTPFPIRRNSPLAAAELLRSVDSANRTTGSERAQLHACDRPRDHGPRPRSPRCPLCVGGGGCGGNLWWECLGSVGVKPGELLWGQLERVCGLGWRADDEPKLIGGGVVE